MSSRLLYVPELDDAAAGASLQEGSAQRTIKDTADAVIKYRGFYYEGGGYAIKNESGGRTISGIRPCFAVGYTRAEFMTELYSSGLSKVVKHVKGGLMGRGNGTGYGDSHSESYNVWIPQIYETDIVIHPAKDMEFPLKGPKWFTWISMGGRLGEDWIASIFDRSGSKTVELVHHDTEP